MKKIVEYFRQEGILFRSLSPIAPKELGSRKKVEIYLGVDTKSFYTMILFIEKKSRILRKESEALMQLHTQLEKKISAKIVKKYILVAAPLCSKAKRYMEEQGWRVVEVGAKEA